MRATPHRAWPARARLALLGATLLVAATAAPARTREDALALEPNAARGVESCVSAERIVFGVADRSALLDAPDRQRVGAAMLGRYPVLAEDGFAPSQILLWQRPAGEALYVTLLANPARPAEACFTATFAGSAFELTPVLLKKYFPARPSR